MAKRSIEELNREFYLYFDRWSKDKDYGGLANSVVISKDGVISCKCHLPHQLCFSENRGECYFTVGVGLAGRGLREAVEKEHEKIEEHLALMEGIRKESPSRRKIKNSRYFSEREIVENGDYVKIKVRIKRASENLNVLFDNVRACIIQPTFRAVDKVRGRRI